MPLLDLPSAHFDNDALLEIPEVAIAELNGEEDLDKLSAIANNVLAQRDFIYTLSVMCSPGVEQYEDIIRLNHAIFADQSLSIVQGLREAGVPLTVDPDVALSFDGREDWRLIVRRMLDRDWLAHIASGYILRWVVSRWQQPETQPEASLTRAIDGIAEWCRRNRVVGGGKQNIKKHLWPRYKSVSHLWAAWYILEDVGVELLTPAGLSEFFATAYYLLHQASTIVPKRRRAGEALLSIDEAWQVPPAFAQRLLVRTEDGQEHDLGFTGAWIDDLNAHDIRNRIVGERGEADRGKAKKVKPPKRKGRPGRLTGVKTST
ncbi:hypothetical protein FHP25_13360 [Vineibacter terrae]|uniref:Uncharacterized protein n=1 Tax=Vineibacter terrae TaxID=2586908 RepID=A0A5C8PN95_9HYPH|nr:hypothetical protein [Vineibacter terrae]TXL75637.1 hypothetical protein FHP25_13360 [Vineibacter terrae]